MAEIEERAITLRIRQARKEAGLTQPQLAERLHVKPRTYQNYESQDNPRVPWDKINALAKITGKTSEWIIHGNAPDLMGSLDGRSQLDRIEAAQAELLARLIEIQATLETTVPVPAASPQPAQTPERTTRPKSSRAEAG